ncbi:hypothetical protein DOTSEDRAFT_49381 [Dothistroma septosporum NZE10]|uniref:Chromosome transmission fidelity protein 8 n=1 Tax=Dothistroma septosporum (strain NZE10 / CBS 128990) TaxID=675120 RepID=N1Q040_DOTSN|nr:hypothetical protein DOTSEDRAFT_49381 [Dothistroma septosporum NZE10]
MPSVSLLPPAAERASNGMSNPLPAVLQTPSGLAMVELQGSVLVENAGAGEELQLGNLVFPPAEDDEDNNGDWDGKRVFLFVGKHQRMAGEVKKLTKPVAVLRRRPVAADANPSTPGAEEVEIAEVIYRKILFAQRPEPVGGEQQQQQQQQQQTTKE